MVQIYRGLQQFMWMRGDDVKELDVVLLKDGRQGTILEVFGQGEAYLIEVADDKGKTIDTLTIPKAGIIKTEYTA